MAATLVGGKALIAKLKRLETRLESSAIRTALLAGGDVFRKAMRSRSRSKRVRSSIRISMQSTAGRVYAAKIGPGAKAIHLARFEERGTKGHRLPKRGYRHLYFGGRFASWAQHPGTKAHPFIGPAFEAERSTALSTVADYLGREIKAEMD